MTKRFVRLTVAELAEVMDKLALAGARLDGARFNYATRGVPIDPEIREEVEAGRQHLANARSTLRQLVSDAGARV